MASALTLPTLVLNRNWQAVNVVPASQAIVMLWRDAAKVVDHDYQQLDWNDWANMEPQDGESFIRTVRSRIRVPEVITLTGYDRMPVAAVTFSRRNIFKRDHNACQYCRKQFHTEDLTIDHILPRSRGGKSTWENCCAACLPCNKFKDDRLPEEAGMKLKTVPIRPSWKPLYMVPAIRHASWSKFLSEAYWNVELQP